MAIFRQELKCSNPLVSVSAVRVDCAVCGCYRNADMARKEGVRRIVTTGKLLVSIAMTLGVVSGVMIYIQYPAALYVVSIAFRVAALGGLVWAAGWIADGFTAPDP